MTPSRADREALAANLRRHRQAADLTQAQLAEKASLDASVISRLENARHWPRTVTAMLLCRALGISIDALLAGTFWSTPPTSPLEDGPA